MLIRKSCDEWNLTGKSQVVSSYWIAISVAICLYYCFHFFLEWMCYIGIWNNETRYSSGRFFIRHRIEETWKLDEGSYESSNGWDMEFVHWLEMANTRFSIFWEWKLHQSKHCLVMFSNLYCLPYKLHIQKTWLNNESNQYCDTWNNKETLLAWLSLQTKFTKINCLREFSATF